MVAGRSVYAINTSCKELSESKTTRGVRGRTYTSTFECFRSSSAHGHYPHRYMVHYLKVREAMDSVVPCEAARGRQRKNVWTHEGRIQHAKRWLAPRERGQAPRLRRLSRHWNFKQHPRSQTHDATHFHPSCIIVLCRQKFIFVSLHGWPRRPFVRPSSALARRRPSHPPKKAKGKK